MGLFQKLLGLFQRHKKSSYAYKLPCNSYIDPLSVYKNLLKADINKYLKERQTKEELKYIQAEINLCTVIRGCFSLPEFNTKTGVGYTDQDCLDVLADFLEYIEKKDQKAKTSVTLPQPTELMKNTVQSKKDCGCT